MKSKQKQNRRAFMKTMGTGIGTGLILGSMGISSAAKADDTSMPFFEVIESRRSVRKYKSTPVPKEHLEKIITAARLCPTAGNRQPWKFVIVQDPQKVEELKAATIPLRLKVAQGDKKLTAQETEELKKKVEENHAGYFSAPVYIGVLTDSEAQYAEYNVHDGPLVAGYLCIAARALGYGTVYLTDSIPGDALRQIAKIPARYEITCVIPLGIPESWPPMPPKKSLDELVIFNSF